MSWENESTVKIALLGYGKMGRLVEELAPGADCQVTAHFDTRHPLEKGDFTVAVDFSVPGAVAGNVRQAAGLGINLVVGTTGWYERLDEVRDIVKQGGIGVVYGANFSIGVNLFFRMVREAAELMKQRPEYDPWIWEMHHRAKKDAPSGTALKLQAVLEQAYGRGGFSVSSNRAGAAPGTHTVGFDSEADTLTFTHQARSRKGFALGALQAARWIHGRKGFYEFSEVLWEARR